MRKIKLDAEQTRSLLMNGECSLSGAMYEVASVGLFVRFEENGVLRVVDAPQKRAVGRPKKEKTEENGVKRVVGRPKKKVFIRIKEDSGIFVEVAGKFIEGDKVESLDGRVVRVVRAEAKVGMAVSDAEWHLMGCDWVTDKVADMCKSAHLSHLGLGLDEEMGLYWFERVEE